jgi:hypothetical protein
MSPKPKPKLNDLQLILLATAIQRDDGSIFPAPDSIADQSQRIRKAIPALLRRQLIVEVPVSDRSKTWREHGEQPIGLVISEDGRTIVAAGALEEQAPSAPPAAAASSAEGASTQAPASPQAGSKIETVIGLLRRDNGATLAAMVEATGWLPHTTRAALTGLRKKGHAVTKAKRDDVTVYHIAQSRA